MHQLFVEYKKQNTEKCRIKFMFTSTKATAGTKLDFCLVRSSFLLACSSFLAEAFRKDHVAAFSTARRNATEKNEMSGYVTVPCSPKVTQRSSTSDWLKL